ncbi:unnamed protein product, partial [Brassica oleracea var. botrytis]
VPPQPKFAVRNMHVYKIAQYRTHTKFEIALINTMKFSAVAIGLYDYPSLSLPSLPNLSYSCRTLRFTTTMTLSTSNSKG